MCPPRKNAEPWLWLKHHPEIAAGLNKTQCSYDSVGMTCCCSWRSAVISKVPWSWSPGTKAGRLAASDICVFLFRSDFSEYLCCCLGWFSRHFLFNCGRSGKNNFRIFRPFLGLSCGSVLSSFEGSPGVTRKGRGTGNAGQGEGLLGAEEPHYPCSGLPVAFTGRSLDPWKSSKPAYLRKTLFLASSRLLWALWVLSWWCPDRARWCPEKRLLSSRVRFWGHPHKGELFIRGIAW